MSDIELNTKKCLICNRPNDTIHYHMDPEDGSIWLWCNGTCQRGYSLYEYTAAAGISLTEFLKHKFEFVEAKSNEVQKMEWPKSFVPLFDKAAIQGVEYIRSRGLDPDDGMYYDTWRKGIVFPYYYDTAFVGAQIRFIGEFIDKDGSSRKIDTLPGTRLGLLFYNWNGAYLMPNVRGVIITEGAFNCKAIEQSLNKIYGSILNNPWKCIATSGSGASKYQTERMRELKDQGIKIVLAPDSDAAGEHMMEKFAKAEAMTHYAFTQDASKDWNDVYKNMGKDEFAKWFLKQIKKI